MRGRRKAEPQYTIHGVVKARKCKCCGHHEIGIVTGSGEYIALKPGMKIAVFRETEKKA